MPISKNADDFYHVTTIDNLRKALDSGGKLRTLRHLAYSDPDAEVDVELSPFPIQRRMKASDAYDALNRVKNVGEIHFTLGGYLPNYGDIVVKKNLGKSLKERIAFNTIPEEYSTKREVSLKNADIYVPTDYLSEIQSQYGKKYKLHDKNSLNTKPYGLSDRLSALAYKAGIKIGLVNKNNKNNY